MPENESLVRHARERTAFIVRRQQGHCVVLAPTFELAEVAEIRDRGERVLRGIVRLDQLDGDASQRVGAVLGELDLIGVDPDHIEERVDRQIALGPIR